MEPWREPQNYGKTTMVLMGKSTIKWCFFHGKIIVITNIWLFNIAIAIYMFMGKSTNSKY